MTMPLPLPLPLPAPVPAPNEISPVPRNLRMLLNLALALFGIYALVIAALWWKQEALLFHPDKLPAEFRFEHGADVHETWVEVPGARLNALHLQLPHPDGVVFFLHGNAGSLQSWFVNADFYRRLNLDLFMIDYRGFGKSSGRIENEAQLHSDVRAAWASIASRYQGQRRIFLGRSLGTGLAAALAAEVQPELTVLVSPYFSMQGMASHHYPWVPGAVLRYPLRTDAVLPQIKGPLLLVHGEKDELIPPDNSERLLRLSIQARYLHVPGAAHNDLQEFPVYLDGVSKAMAAR
jgi:pimeloyl-ACP methyl ester carboxylesterase